MTNPLEQASQQVEIAEPLNHELLEREAALVLRDYYQPDVIGVAEKLRKSPEPSFGYWEPCAKEYGKHVAPKLDELKSGYEDAARSKMPEDRDGFDEFVLGVSAFVPADVRAPEGSYLTPYGYYKDTGKRLLAALEEGKMPEGFETPELLAKATDFLLARGISELLATPDRASVDLRTGLALLREATEHVPGFDPDGAGLRSLIPAGINCRGILEAESGHWKQTGSAGRAQASSMLLIAAEAVALDNIHNGLTLSARYDRQAAFDQELAAQDAESKRSTDPQWPTEEWPTEESEASGPLPEVVTSLKGTEQDPDDDPVDTPPRGTPVLHPSDTSTEEATRQARHNVNASFDGDRQMVFTDTAGREWERQPHNTVVNPDGPEPVWRTQSTDSSETEHVLVPADIRVEQRPPTGWPSELEAEPQIGDSRLDQFLARAGQGLRRWSRANATHNPDARLKNQVGNAFKAIGGLFNGKNTSSRPLTAAEMDRRDQEEYDRVDALVAEGNTVSYDANGNAVVSTEPQQPRSSWRERREARQQARAAAREQSAPNPEQPQTAADSRLEQLRQQTADRNARWNRLDDHLAHNEEGLAIQEINNLPADGLQLPYKTIINLSGAPREAWELRVINESSRPDRRILPPPAELILTDAGRRAYEQKFPGRRKKLPWEK